MITNYLIKQEWLKTFRAPGFYRNLIVNILLGFFALYMGLVMLFLGFTLRKILLEVLPQYSPVETIYGSLLYLIIGGLSVRFLMQQLNTLNLQPLQILPIKRSTLVNYLLLKPLINPVNYLTLLIFIPFSIQAAIHSDISAWQAAGLVLSVVFIVWFNSLMTAFLKRKFGSSVWGILIVVLGLTIVGALEYFNLFSLFDVSRLVFKLLLSNPFGVIVVALLPIGAFALNKWFFSQNYYPEKFNEKIESKKVFSAEFSFMSRLGKIGELIALEMKLILRHKRTKSILLVSVLFLAYGLLFYPNPSFYSNTGLLFFVAMFITGIFMLMYGQWIISWDGGYFDCLMSKKIDTHTYLQANYMLLTAFNVISFVLTTPYFFFGEAVIYNHIAAFLYNMGVNTIFYLYVAPYNTKRLDLSKGSAMNYQGTTFKNFLFVLPMMFIPLVFVSVMSAFDLSNIALIILASLGVLGLVFQKQLLALCERNFLRRKYKLCEGFRKKE